MESPGAKSAVGLIIAFWKAMSWKSVKIVMDFDCRCYRLYYFTASVSWPSEKKGQTWAEWCPALCWLLWLRVFSVKTVFPPTTRLPHEAGVALTRHCFPSGRFPETLQSLPSNCHHVRRVSYMYCSEWLVCVNKQFHFSLDLYRIFVPASISVDCFLLDEHTHTCPQHILALCTVTLVEWTLLFCRGFGRVYF